MIANDKLLLSRRQLLGFSGAALALTAIPAWFIYPASAPVPNSKEYWISASGAQANQYSLGWIDSASVNSEHSSTESNYTAALSGFRGHDVIQHAKRPTSALMFARRPGMQGIEVDLLSGVVNAGFQCGEGRHLFGHGCFSADGQYLFTTETDYEKGVGLIVVRDADSYQQLDEWPSYGVGPHELKLMPDGKTLVVANGGMLTHPKSGREILNLDTMASSLSYINIADGSKQDDFRVAEPKASIRHLDVADDGTVAFAIQLQRQATAHDNIIALGGVHKKGATLELFQQPAAVIAQLNDYMGSVAINGRSRLAGFTSPRGNLAAFWHLDTQEFVGYHALRDVCGIASSTDKNAFILSNSLGEMRVLDAISLKEQREQRIENAAAWDNHLSAIKIS